MADRIWPGEGDKEGMARGGGGREWGTGGGRGDIQESGSPGGKLLEGGGRGRVSLRGQEEEYWDRGRGRKDGDLGLREG